MTSREDLLKELEKVMRLAHSEVLGILAESGFDQLYKRIKLDKIDEKRIDNRFRFHADEILEKVEAAGYALPPVGDLRAQLLRVARELKACSFSAGYSGDNGVEDRIAEAKADVKSAIGAALLDALAGE